MSSKSKTASTTPQRPRIPRSKKLPKPPIKEILLAVGLFLGGSILITIGVLIILGYFGDSPDLEERGIPVLVTGCIMFLPGSYITHIAYNTYKGVAGFTYDQIPRYD
eukprot:TRINITY_DN2091_c0_g1_i1.p1 TRINITY_DN2091_c0_g1~~TRINITY_DN2091_c0_g1_i1.p1  ORF type:complete len:125 (-),score=29.28 TRINITY_DN2091_c0_g1_i1:52-372(-)